MSKKYKTYDEDFKKTLVSLYESGKKVSDLSREYGVKEATIRPWITKYGTIITSTGETTNNDEANVYIETFISVMWESLKNN